MSLPEPGESWPFRIYHDLPGAPRAISEPKVLRVNPEGHVTCPHCKCKTTCEITIDLEVSHFKDGKGTGRYTGCPGCGWLSPMDVHEGEYVE
jgi:hypothetical protein